MIIALAALALPAQARAAAKPFFAVRSQARDAMPPAATRALERRLGDQATVDLDPVTRTPRVLARLDGALSGPASGSAADVALRYVRANLAALGLEEADLETLRPPASDTVGGITTIRWRQAVDGIAAADSELRVNVDRDGRVLSVLGSPASGLDADTTPTVTAGEAVRIVQDDAGVHRALPRKAGGARSVTYVDGTTAALALYTGRLVWRVTYRAGDDAVYDVMVDARTGKLLRRANLVKSAVPVLVWDTHPVGPMGGATERTLPTAADPNPWLVDATRLYGPTVHAYVDADDDPQTIDEVVPDRYAFTAFGACGAATPCSWTDADKTTNRRQNAVQAFYFANRFHDHLAALGFDAISGAFEDVDRLILETSDGADVDQRDNAYMYTPPNGKSPLMQMQLWSRERNVNAGDDASILYHEYTHGLSNRLITDAAGAGALNSPQAGAMGEGWSDWYAKDFIDPVDGPAADNEVQMGDYVGTGIREQGLDCPVGGTCPSTGTSGPGGFTYGDYGKVIGEPEIHADGEIWAQALWDLRKALGPAEARRVITEGMRLTPPEPSFLDARNAILLLAADDAQRTQMWTVFARRGMGYYASTTGAEDVAPVEDFLTPPAPGGPTGTITGSITDVETGAGIGGASARVGGSSDLAATTAGDGSYTLTAPARAYRSFVIDADGYDRIIQPVTVGAGGTTLNAALRRNWASASGGATSLGGDLLKDRGCGSSAAIDQRPGTVWSTSAADATMVVTLPRVVDVRGFAVDPGEGCADGDEAAAASVRIDTSPTVGAGGPWTVAATPTFGSAHRHRMNHFPAQVANVRSVRVSILSTQGLSAYYDLSEFGVYSTEPPVVPTPTPTPFPSVDPTPTATATPPPTPIATASPPPPPTATPTATPQPRPAFRPSASGKRSIKVRATCPLACAVRAELKVDARTAKRLGSTRTVGTYRKTLKAGTTTFNVKLSSKVRRGLLTKVKSFKATLTVRSGAVVTTRKVTVKR